MIDPLLEQQTLDYLAQFGLANLPDQQLPTAIREMMVSRGAQMAARVKDADDNWQLVFITDTEYQAARAAGIPPQHYAEIKISRQTFRETPR